MSRSPGTTTWLLLFVVPVLLAITVGGWVLWRGHVVQSVIDDLIYDNKTHHLACEELPTAERAKAVVEKHRAEIRKIEQVDPGNVLVSVDTSSCPGKGELLITYPSHEDRVEIEGMLGESFHGVPYTLRNV